MAVTSEFIKQEVNYGLPQTTYTAVKVINSELLQVQSICRYELYIKENVLIPRNMRWCAKKRLPYLLAKIFSKGRQILNRVQEAEKSEGFREMLVGLEKKGFKLY